MCSNPYASPFCSVGLQADTVDASTCPPEGGRYIDQNQVLMQILHPPKKSHAGRQKRKKPQSDRALRLFTNETGKLKLYAFGFFQWRRHLQPRLRKGLDQGVFHRFGGGVSCGGEFADEEEFGSLEHFLFAERERLCP